MGWIAYDSLTPEINESAFDNGNWSVFYGDVWEGVWPKMPSARGNLVTMPAFVDANHAGNVMTRQSNTGIILYLQNALIVWYIRRQNMIKAVQLWGRKPCLHQNHVSHQFLCDCSINLSNDK
jgi:hypothetical protein